MVKIKSPHTRTHICTHVRTHTRLVHDTQVTDKEQHHKLLWLMQPAVLQGQCTVFRFMTHKMSSMKIRFVPNIIFALHPSGVAKSNTSFGWGKGGKVTSARWQVTLCVLIWHVISRSGVVILITNCYIRLTLLNLLLLWSRPWPESSRFFR